MLNFNNKKILIVGGGKIATEKTEKILDFSKNITIIASKLNEKMQALTLKHNLTSYIKNYEKNDATGFDLIIICVDDINLQEQIFKNTRSSRVLINSVDSPQWCDFIFPSYIKRDELVVAISSSSYAPALSRALRIYLEKFIPDNLNHLLKRLKNIRTNKPKGKERQAELSNIVNNFFKEIN